jgi:hypothetical protein
MPNFTGLWTPAQQIQAKGLGIWPATPGAPTSVTATAGNASASVAFTAPTDTGYPANAITSYTATSSPGSFTATGAASPLTVVGLTNGTSYTFTVRATNSAGSGPASAASSSVSPVAPTYVDDLFSSSVYAGSGNQQSINNGIDLLGSGGLVWIKNRTDQSPFSNYSHQLFDTARGFQMSGAQPMGRNLQTNTTDAQAYLGYGFSAFNSNGFRVGYNDGAGTNVADANVNGSASNYISWSFRKQPKFFDVVTYTGTGVNNRTINHSLGSVPGCVLIKRTDASENWAINHRGNGTGNAWYLSLNLTNAGSQGVSQSYATSTTVNVTDVIGAGSSPNGCNVNGATYVAYIFAHNAGGFGDSGNDNVITCSSFTTSGTGTPNATVTLGFTPQWLLIKRVDSSSSWYIYDIARGLIAPNGLGSAYSAGLSPNGNGGDSNNAFVNITTNGFVADTGGDAQTWIYVAIARPNKPPTTATSVFAIDRPSSSGTFTLESPFAPDFAIAKGNTGGSSTYVGQRLTGTGGMDFLNANEEFGLGYRWNIPTGATIDGSGNYSAWISYLFKRAPGFFDCVAYTGTNTSGGAGIPHKLGVTPEMIIVKSRNASYGWCVYNSQDGYTYSMFLNTTAARTTSNAAWNSEPNSTAFFPTSYAVVNGNQTYTAYLFATLAGISKVGGYTGTGTTLQVDCGFTAGARFVMIKRRDSTGDWYFWDTVRGIISGNDPYMLFNSSAAEVTNTDYIDPYSAGFEISSTAPAGINANGGTYVFLAIA